MSYTTSQGIRFNIGLVYYCPNLGWRIPDYWKWLSCLRPYYLWRPELKPCSDFFHILPSQYDNILLCFGGLLQNKERTDVLPPLKGIMTTYAKQVRQTFFWLCPDCWNHQAPTDDTKPRSHRQSWLKSSGHQTEQEDMHVWRRWYWWE